MPVNLRLLATALLAALPVAAFAQPAASVSAQDVWARATPPGAPTGVIYLTLTSPAGDRLEAASTPRADRASVHESRMDGDVMRMRPVEGGVELPAGRPVMFRPAGVHIMLEGLKGPLKLGEAVPLHLVFQHAPPLDIQAQVRAAGATQPSHGTMPGMEPGQ